MHTDPWTGFALAGEPLDLVLEGPWEGLNHQSIFQHCKVVLGRQPQVERRNLYCSCMNKALALGMTHLIFSGVDNLGDL